MDQKPGEETSHYLLDYDGKREGNGDLWDSTFIPFMNAIFDGKRAMSVDMNYTHPAVQREVEENDFDFSKKRLDQLDNLVGAFIRNRERILGKSRAL
ncbi:MAG: hypothetical protein NTX24_00855 [Candidatus Pacearchaeota archaeon]|nr:hypothetical protein [Candidatus Pacearchaeota archaeon]